MTDDEIVNVVDELVEQIVDAAEQSGTSPDELLGSIKAELEARKEAGAI